MDVDHLFAGIRLAAFVGTTGAFFAFGFIAVCKVFKWPPVNITVNNYRSARPSPTKPGGDGE